MIIQSLIILASILGTLAAAQGPEFCQERLARLAPPAPSLFVTRMAPENPSHRVLIVHGVGEHSLRHSNTLGALFTAGIEVVLFDLRGCGKSDGERQVIKHFQDYVEDVHSVVEWLDKKQFGKLPLVLLGHSLGGTVAMHYVRQHPDKLAGLALSAPAYKFAEDISRWMIALATLGTVFTPNKIIRSKIDTTDLLTRDPVEREKKRQDPLNIPYYRARQGFESLRAMAKLPLVASELALPIFLAHGSGDRKMKIEGSRELFRRFPNPDNVFYEHPGGYHELHNDFGKEDYFRALTDWIKSIP